MVDSTTMVRLGWALCLAGSLGSASALGQLPAPGRPLPVNSPLKFTVSGPRAAYFGQPITLQVEVRNTGDVTTAASDVDLFTVGETTKLSIGSLAPKASQSMSVSCTPSALACSASD